MLKFLEDGKYRGVAQAVATTTTMQSSNTTVQHVETPPKLWREIFRLATYLPGLLDTDWRIDRGGWRGDQKIRTADMKAAFLTKRRIVQVCSMWRYLGMEFFSEYLHLDWDVFKHRVLRWEFVPQFLTLFQLPSYDCARWLRVINIDGDFIPAWRAGIVGILEACHNLVSFQHGACQLKGEWDVEFACLFERRFSHSLRKLDYFNVESTFDSPTIPNIPLHQLRLSLSRSVPEIPERPLESISTLCLACYNIEELPWHFPSLRHFHIPFSPLVDTCKPGVVAFIERHRETLVSLAFHNNDSAFWLWPTVARIQVQNLQIPYSFLKLAQTTTVESLPSVINLAVSYPASDWDDATLYEIFDCVAQTVLLPNLRVLKLLLSRSRLQEIRPGSTVKEAATKCMRRGIRVDDDEGTVVSF